MEPNVYQQNQRIIKTQTSVQKKSTEGKKHKLIKNSTKEKAKQAENDIGDHGFKLTFRLNSFK